MTEAWVCLPVNRRHYWTEHRQEFDCHEHCEISAEFLQQRWPSFPFLQCRQIQSFIQPGNYVQNAPYQMWHHFLLKCNCAKLIVQTALLYKPEAFQNLPSTPPMSTQHNYQTLLLLENTRRRTFSLIAISDNLMNDWTSLRCALQIVRRTVTLGGRGWHWVVCGWSGPRSQDFVEMLKRSDGRSTVLRSDRPIFCKYV